MLKSLSLSSQPHINRIVWGILLLAGLFGFGFSLAPPFEGPDENSHFDYISYLYHQKQLPNPADFPYGAAHHPPLYYATFAPLLVFWGDEDRSQLLSRRNSMFPGLRGTVGGADNRNRLVHYTNELGLWPQSPTVRSLRLMRWMNLCLNLGTAILLWKSLRDYIWPEQPWLALASLAVILFNPKYLQFTAFLNNDNFLWLFCAGALYLLLKQLQAGYSWQRSCLLGTILGLGLLNKFNSMVLIGPVMVTFLYQFWQARQWRIGLSHLALVLMINLLIASPWIIHNIQRYGEPTGYIGGVDVAWQGERIEGNFNLQTGLKHVYPYAIQSFWHYLGTDSIELPMAIWRFYQILMVGGGVGLVLQAYYRWRQARLPLAIIVLLGSTATVFIILLIVVASLYVSDNQGRYLFPAMLAWGSAIVGGWRIFIPEQWQPWGAKLLIITMILLCGIALWGYFLPAFNPHLQAADDRRALACFAMHNQPIAELVSFEPRTIYLHENRPIQVKMEWRALAIPTLNLWEYAHVVGPHNQLIEARDSIPGSGNHPSANWQIGQQWRSTLWLKVAGPGQNVYPLEIGLYIDPLNRLQNCTGNAPINPAQVVIHGEIQSLPENLIARMGPDIGLVNYQLRLDDDLLTLMVEWAAIKNGQQNLNFFVQLRDNQNAILAQYDGKPKHGRYPTLFWQQGERIADRITIALPNNLPPAPQVFIGFYLPPNQGALPIQANGQTYYAGLPLNWPTPEG